jgi:peptidoglycan/xylan/chitin deacetylase (PgdA/CDA1 family)
MRRRLRTILTNPLLILLPIAIVLIAGWHQYTYAGMALSVPASNGNVLPNGNFDLYGQDGMPVGWQVQKTGDVVFQTSKRDGYVGGNSFGVRVTKYSSGDVTLEGPKVSLQAQQTYLFKGYFKATKPFALLARYFHRDGTSQLMFLDTYPGNASAWSTASDAFASADNVTAVQFVYRLTSLGDLQINGLYLEPKQQVYVAPTPPAAPNLIPNAGLAGMNGVDMPDGWTTYHAGDNTAAFSYDRSGRSPLLHMRVSDYKDGQAKWQYVPQAVTAHQQYEISLSYQSDVPVGLVAEYTTQGGSRQFDTIASLGPAGDWTTMTSTFEVPSGATTLFVSAVLKHNGTLATRDFRLTNVTKPGAAQWTHPLVSITFDDGWQSAYADAVPILNRYGFKATFYINPASIETPQFMTADQLEALFTGGQEIASHGYTHDDMVSLDDGRLDYQLHEGRDYLRRAGFAVSDFAPPYGNSDAEVQWYARQYFKSLRTTEIGVNTRQNFNPYGLKVLYVDSTTKTAAVSAMLDDAKRNNGWLILVYHQVGSTPPASSLKVEHTTIATDMFAGQVDLIKKDDVTVLPVAEALREVQSQ